VLLIIYYITKSNDTICRLTLNKSKSSTSNRLRVRALDNYMYWTLIRCQI